MWRAGERVGGLLDDDELRRFAFEFLTVDPFFFGSGYAKENMLRRIRKPVLTEAEKATLRGLILKRIDGPGMREFRHVCCMVPRAGSPDLEERITSLAQSTDPSVRVRAAFAERYFQHEPY